MILPRQLRMMLDVALRDLGSIPYLNTVSETVVCLPDAVQLLTPCTIGNGFLQVLDWGKFALTAYDRLTLSGVRAWLNPDGLVNYPLVRRWFERSKGGSTQKPVFEDLSSEILSGWVSSLRLPVRATAQGPERLGSSTHRAVPQVR